MASVKPATSQIASGAVAPPDGGPTISYGPGPGRAAPDDIVVIPDSGLGGRFWRLWWATAVSSSGDGLMLVALPLLTFTLTHDALVIAGVTAAQRTFAALAALPAGVITDRYERRNVMVACDIASGLVLAGLVGAVSLKVAELFMVYLVACVLAASDVTYTLALQASFPDVIASPEQLATANGRLMGVSTAGESFAGPGLGGILFAAARRLPFLADGVSFFLAAGLVATSVPRAKPRLLHARGAPPRDGGPARTRAVVDGQYLHASGWTADFRTGWRVFRSQKVMKLLAATVGSVTFSQAIVFSLLVLYGERSLRLRSTGYGVFIMAASVLGVIGMLAGGAVLRRFGGARTIVGGAFLVSVSFIGLAFTRQAVVAVFVLGLQEVGTAVLNVASVTTRQRLIPRPLFGRVGSVYRLMVAVTAPLGALMAGVVASLWGVKVAFLAAGVAQALALAYLGPALLRALAADEASVPA